MKIMALSKNKKEMMKLKTEKGTSIIPTGCYCYGATTCPYWDFDSERNLQKQGYCWFLEDGDWITNETAVLKNLKTGEMENAKDLPFPVGLLWDQCKECGINDYE